MTPAAHTALPSWSKRLISELEANDRRAERLAKVLTLEQLNWRPRPDAWSIGQCLHHLHKTNEVYLPAISISLEGRRRGAIDEIRLGWFSRWFMRNYITRNPGGAKARAPGKIVPSQKVEPSVLEWFLQSNRAARELVYTSSDYDVNRIRFKNPFIPVLRFTVGTGLEIVAQHQSRHLLQGEGVRQSAEFPKQDS